MMNEDQLLRNAKEVIEYFRKNGFVLSENQPKFIKTVEFNKLSSKLLIDEMINTWNMMDVMNGFIGYRWRSGLNCDCIKDKYIVVFVEFLLQFHGNMNNIEVYARFKSIVDDFDNDKEGNEDYTKEDIKKEFALKYLNHTKEQFIDWKQDLMKLQNESEWNENKVLLKKLSTNIDYLAVPMINPTDGTTKCRPKKLKII
eukprot:UN09988